MKPIEIEPEFKPFVNEAFEAKLKEVEQLRRTYKPTPKEIKRACTWAGIVWFDVEDGK